MLVCSIFLMQIARETAGAARIRSSLRPLLFQRANEMQNSGRIAPRDQERMSHNAIACNKREAFVQGSEATRQSISPREERMDCFASLAMTKKNGGEGPAVSKSGNQDA
jgi:hypothetical protein